MAGRQSALSMLSGNAPTAEEFCELVAVAACELAVVVNFCVLVVGELVCVVLVVVPEPDVEFQAEAISCKSDSERPTVTRNRQEPHTSAKCPPTLGLARNGLQLLPMQVAFPVAVSYQSEIGYELRPDARYLCR